ncbi:MAG TPA: sigma-70 family RNA polymerase sigma factor [Woeseiaceae bacterium]|nr:sigma-70 family RNA polymerase sigma factor [Woeseiaceae bacterium]
MTPSPTVTSLLRDWRSGDADALQQLTPLVYDDLRRIAENHLRSERAGHTLQATALVNEAFVRLADADSPFEDRAHFFALAARVMRHILADYGRNRNSLKRGGGLQAVTLQEQRVASPQSLDIIELDDALTKLAKIDERKSDILVLHFFGGLTYGETAAALGISAKTVDRNLRLAKAWLANELAFDQSRP